MRQIRVLVLKQQGLAVKLEDDFQAWKDYELKQWGVELLIDVKEVNISPLTHKEFRIVQTSIDASTGQPVTTDMYGLDNIMARVLALNVVPAYTYQAVIFVYNITQTPWYAINPQDATTHVANWTHYDPLMVGTEFIEVVVDPQWSESDPFRVFTHEIRHATVARLRLLGHPVEDVMDSTPVKQFDGTIKYIPYYKEFDVFATDGNRATQTALLLPFADYIASAPSPETNIYISLLKAQLALLYIKIQNLMNTTPKDSPGMLKWAEGAKQYEGWAIGTRSYRNNNPGNFRYPAGSTYMTSLGAIGRDRDGFAMFPNYQTGWNALLQFLRDARANQLISYRAYAKSMARPNNMCTLGDFYHVYAPAADSNDPLKYATWIANYIGNGVTVGTRIDQI